MTDPLHHLSRAREKAPSNLAGTGPSGSFESVERSYEALRSDAALVQLGFLSAFEVLGPDATDFLQGMISNDVMQIAAGQGCLAVILTPIGKLIADLTVLKFSKEKFWLVCRSELKGKTMDALKRFIVSDQVDVKDLPAKSAIGIIGPRSGERLERLAGSRPQRPYEHREMLLDGHIALLTRDTRYGVDGYQIWFSQDGAMQLTQQIEKKCEVARADPEAFETLRIEAGVPVYGTDFDETNIPLEANLDNALNFQKGCYTGQEVIARVTYLGSVSKKLAGLVVEGDTVPKAGEEVLVDGRQIGRVTSAARSLRLRRPIALAYIQKLFLKPGTRVELKISGCGASVQSLPLVPAQ
ncbi:MAG TPA: glycine cleavage T C-terminal barrel domain-containing protein [Acidobacteriota bacterium]